MRTCAKGAAESFEFGGLSGATQGGAVDRVQAGTSSASREPLRLRDYSAYAPLLFLHGKMPASLLLTSVIAYEF